MEGYLNDRLKVYN